MDWLKRLLGYRYLVNMRSAEVHDIKGEKGNCRISKISKENKRWITDRKLDKLRAADKVNGCRWCMPYMDTDKRKWRKSLTEKDLKA
jgi:hypothetical protein